MEETKTSSDYDSAQRFLHERINYECQPTIPYHEQTLKLERMRRFLELLGNPQQHLKIVHIAGTKGKGSTATMIASVLQASGMTTGLLTSPHLDHVEQRVVINRASCERQTFADLISRMRPVVNKLDRQLETSGETGLTYFEITTALALLHFAEVGVDITILEVGLGGRLDATNVCSPVISVITNISFDHTQQLGNSLAKIAAEKGGIIKPGIPVISGIRNREPREVVAQICDQRKSKLIQIGKDFEFDYQIAENDLSNGQFSYREPIQLPKYSISDVPLGLLGRHQAANAAIATATVRHLNRKHTNVSDSQLRNGLATAHCPARVEVVGKNPTVVIDAAHNAASIDALTTTLGEHFHCDQRLAIISISKNKDVRTMLERLIPHFSSIYFTQYSLNPRAVPAGELKKLAEEIIENSGQISPSNPTLITIPKAHQAWSHVLQQASPNDIICITGSFYIAAEMRTWIEKNSMNEIPRE